MKKRFLTLGVLTMVLLLQSSVIFAENSSQQTAPKLLDGKYISVMGDSISTYTGWSNKYPITDEGCTNRYGEPYYGPVGSECHNTELTVEDTWWYQSAEILGAEILVSNAGNSTGLLHASYPQHEGWQLYLQEMLAYKSRPYYLGVDGKVPDIIALYIGSNDMAKVDPSQFGSVSDINFDTLIVANGDGTFTYAEPTTVAEAYCIMLHKIEVTYPNAEVYCFTVVPNSGGYLSTCNKRLVATCPFNEMVKEVANHYDAIVVDLFSTFQLDPDGDGIAVQEDFDTFKTYFNNDPHPNASGFDLISECFTDTVLENSKYVVSVESAAGKKENVGVDVIKTAKEIQRKANGFVTESGMLVDYWSKESLDSNFQDVFFEKYIATDPDGTYKAEGGSSLSYETFAPNLSVSIPLVDNDSDETEDDETKNGISTEKKEESGDEESPDTDGVYDETKTVLEKPGSLTVQTLSYSVVENVSENNHRGMHYLHSTVVPSAEKNMIVDCNPVVIPQKQEDVPPIRDGYEYVYIGSDQLSNFWAAYAYDSPDLEGYPDESPIYSDNDDSLYVRVNHDIFINRKLVVPKLYLQGNTVEGVFPAWYDSIQQFTLTNKDCKPITAYCADQNTSAVRGYSYRIVNLEDSTYYTDEEADMIYTVSCHGYWGTDSGIGSLSAVKQMMSDSGKFSEEEVSRLNDGMAMTATQYAIWTFSNKMDGKVFTNAYFTSKIAAPSVAADEESADLILKLYHYLINLPCEKPDEIDPSSRNTIINEKHFLDSVSIKIIDKPQDNAKNYDSDNTNDVYRVDISFKLKVSPSTENGDDLVMYIIDEETGKPHSIGRIAGELKENEVQIQKENGKYVFHDIYLEEGIENISFRLSGTQYLGMTPYLFTSENIDGISSQTMVGFAGGSRNVNVKTNLGIKMEIDDDVFSVKHMWRKEQTMEPPSDDPNKEPESDSNKGSDKNHKDDSNKESEKKPEADSDKNSDKNSENDSGKEPSKGGNMDSDGKKSKAPQTGDDQNLNGWFCLAAVSGFVLIGYIFYLKKIGKVKNLKK